jgi:hypothetical protein
MTIFSTTHPSARGSHRRPHSHVIPIVVASTIGAIAIALIAYLLWPTWSTDASNDPALLPISVGDTLFNVPPLAIRMKIQRHSGPQERIDLNFIYPALQVPTGPKHVSADTVEDALPPIDRIFLSIAAHHDSMAPDLRLNTIYPRYLEQTTSPGPDGLTMRAFRDRTPSGGSVFRGYAEAQHALHARWRDTWHVPERAPHRRRRFDVPLSAELARALARGCRCDGPPDGAITRGKDQPIAGVIPKSVR